MNQTNSIAIKERIYTKGDIRDMLLFEKRAARMEFRMPEKLKQVLVQEAEARAAKGLHFSSAADIVIIALRDYLSQSSKMANDGE